MRSVFHTSHDGDLLNQGIVEKVHKCKSKHRHACKQLTTSRVQHLPQSSWINPEVSSSNSQSHEVVTELPSQWAVGTVSPLSHPNWPVLTSGPWSPWSLDFASPQPQQNLVTTFLCSSSQITKWCWGVGTLIDLTVQAKYADMDSSLPRCSQ